MKNRTMYLYVASGIGLAVVLLVTVQLRQTQLTTSSNRPANLTGGAIEKIDTACQALLEATVHLTDLDSIDDDEFLDKQMGRLTSKCILVFTSFGRLKLITNGQPWHGKAKEKQTHLLLDPSVLGTRSRHSQLIDSACRALVEAAACLSETSVASADDCELVDRQIEHLTVARLMVSRQVRRLQAIARGGLWPDETDDNMRHTIEQFEEWFAGDSK